MEGEKIRDKIFSYWSEKTRRPALLAIVFFLVGLNSLVWGRIFFSAAGSDFLEIYALAVGHGDSQLIRLPGGAKVLIDGGPPNGNLLASLADALPANDRRIDLAIISHPQADHFGGFVELAKRYDIGLFLTNGRPSGQTAYQELERITEEKNIDFLPLARGDSIAYVGSRFDVLWPALGAAAAKDLNEEALVVLLSSENASALFTGDIPAATERKLAAFLPGPIDILKVAHHGSKNSSDSGFLKVARPRLALIGVGKNSYGHPTAAVLERLAAVGSAVYRTDQDGTVRLAIDGRKIEVFKEGGVDLLKPE